MMASRIPGGSAARGAARSAAREAAPWIEKLARFGFAAKGAVYVLVGGLALAGVLGRGGGTTGSTGALASIADSSAGRVILALIALGLAGYVVWRIVGALLNPENESTGRRIFFLVTGFIYGLLALEAARLALGNGGGGDGGGGPSHWSAELMQQPFGQWLVGLAGLAVAIYGLQQILAAWQIDLDDRLDLTSMSRTTHVWTVRLSRLGLAARGFVLTIIGGYLLLAAFQADPSEARGLGAVLSRMQDTPWLLGIVALGLMSYGLYNFVRARYRRIRPA